jgi:hypothetical protein
MTTSSAICKRFPALRQRVTSWRALGGTNLPNPRSKAVGSPNGMRIRVRLSGSCSVVTDAVRKLSSICWDFAGAKTNHGPHAIHPYPAKFIPQIPQRLIEMYHPGDGSPVLDPFCGSGTTNVVASAAGLPNVGIDLNPLAALVAKVKTTPLLTSLADAAGAVLAKARRRFETKRFVIPEIPRVDHWFKPAVQAALASIIGEVQFLDDADVSDALKVALSSIIVRVSNQDSDTRYAAVPKDVDGESVFRGFERASVSLDAAICRLPHYGSRSVAHTRIITKDLMAVQPKEIGTDVGLVITSPPYPNAYEYWLYHKYRMYWLGMDPIPVREAEIGARPHYFKKNHQTEHDFERQMGVCFELLSRVMRRGCFACFVVGRSIIHGREIDNEALLARAAARNGFRNLGTAKRTIAATRKSFNLAHGTINREGIMLFVLEGK